MMSTTRSEHQQPIRPARRRGCNEECLRRIAARLCRLDDDDDGHVGGSARGELVARVDGGRSVDGCCDLLSGGDSCGRTTDGEQLAVEKEMETDLQDCVSACCESKVAGCVDPNTTSDAGVTEASGCCSKEGSATGTAPRESTCCVRSDVASGAETNRASDCCSKQSSAVDAGPKASPSCVGPDIASDAGATEMSGCCSKQETGLETSPCCVDSRTAIGAGVTEKSGCCSKQDSDIDTGLKSDSCGALANTADGSCSGEPRLSTEASECVDECCKSVESPDYQTEPVACSLHLRATLDRFEALILQSKCICRKVRRLMGVSCCSLSADGSLATQRLSLASDAAMTSRADSSKGPCRQPKTGSGCCSQKKQDPCKSDQTLAIIAQKDACCSKDEVTCKRSQNEVAKSEKPRTATTQERLVDVEDDAAREHVTLSVSGMTCTGCSTKMMNVLAQMPGVHKPEVTFISGSATFELDGNTFSIEEALPVIEKRTGFKCSRVVDGYQHLVVHMSPELAAQFESENAEGLVGMVRAKKTYRVTYNPRVVGARDLLPPNAKLASATAESSVTEGKLRLITMTWYTGVAAAFTVPIVVLNWAPNPVPRQTRGIVSLVLATVVQAIAVPEFYIGALKSLVFSRVVEMDMLVVISITAAFAYSVIAFGLTEAGFSLEQHAFFETSSLLITLVLFGRLIAAVARAQAIRAVSMRSLQAQETNLLMPDGGTTTIDVRLLQYGDSIVVRPHSRIVTDATVVSGTSTVDESMPTGETVPVSKAKGDTVIAGTLNCEGVLHLRLTRLPGANSIDDIAKSVEKALGARPRIQDLADKVASWFVPLVLAIGVVVFAVWIAVAFRVRGENAGGAVGTAITYTIAVLAVSCPCALGLAVPMVLVIAGGVAARAGVIIKAADATERGYKVTDVVFDKTGTLTKGNLSVVRRERLQPHCDVQNGLSLVKMLVKDNSHPVARAVAVSLEHDDTLYALEVDTINSIPGSGMQAQWNSKSVKLGNPFWLGIENNPTVATLLSEGTICLCLTLDDLPILAFALKDELREEAAAVTAALRKRDNTCHIVSGDHAKAVANVASALALDLANTAHRRSPTQKHDYVKALQDGGKTVLFCGDGTNDAVALAQANVGVQMGTASDVAGAVADVVLLGGLEGLLTLLDISKRAFARVVFNFAWSAVYNVFAILLAAGAFIKFRIPPAYAGLGEIVSVGPVILAAVTLLMGNRKPE